MQEFAVQSRFYLGQRLYLLSAALLGLVALGCGAPDQSAKPWELTEMLSPVCRGNALAEAAAYPGDGVPHVIGVANDSGGGEYAGHWGEWSAAAVEDVQLVACFHTTEDVIEVCKYRGGQYGQATLERIQYTITVTLRAARTAETIDSTSIEGDSPKPCPSQFSSPAPSLNDFPWAQFDDWLGGVAQSP